MSRLILDADAATQKKSVLHTLPDDEMVIQNVQKVDDILAITKEQYKESAGEQWGLRSQVARIPVVVWGDLLRDGIAQDKERLKAWLNDSDNRVWRTRPGRI